MKKFYLGLCIVLLALVLISCGGKKEDAKASKENVKTESVASSVADKAKKVVSSKTFTKKDVLDDFGEPTGNFSYNSKAFRGTYKTFEQAGNTSGDASLYISVDNNKWVSLKVVEDGNTGHFVGAKFTTDKFTIVIREENGEDVTLKDIPIIKDENKLYNTFSTTGIFWPLIRNKAVKLIIKNDSATYNFNSIDTSELEGLLLDKAPYDKAVALMEKGGYKEAMDVFEKYKTDSINSYNFYAAKEKHRDCEVAIWKEKGSAGGYVFYDCDADNESGNADGLKSSECGWRYLEAAPTDLLGKDGKRKTFIWGDDGRFGTKKGIGEGKNNTKIIIEKASNQRPDNAAKACADYEFGGYKDWFLPSIDELNLLYRYYSVEGVGDFSDFGGEDYLSSSEGSHWSDGIRQAWAQSFLGGYVSDGWCGRDGRGNKAWVRPIRAF